MSHSRWPFLMALLLCCATYPLIWVGGLVTTYDAGMAVPDWPSTYGYNLFLYPISTWLSGPFDLFIEHGHRLLGAATGFITILLVVTVWRCDDRSSVRWFSVGCLVGVIAQGILGGARVLLNEVSMARLHGCTGPLFFCMTVAMLMVTSRRWRSNTDSTNTDSIKTASHASLFRSACILTILAYLQLVIGAHLRHLPPMMTPQVFRVVALFHVLTAVAVVFYAISLWLAAYRTASKVRRLMYLMTSGLVLLVLCQIGLGLGTWLVKYNWPIWLPAIPTLDRFVVQEKGFLQGIVITAHVAIGSLILASSFSVALGCYPAFQRLRVGSRKSSTNASYRMEVVV